MGAQNTEKAQDSDAGNILVDRILKIMQLLNIPNGLKEIGYTEKDIPKLVEGARILRNRLNASFIDIL